ncbi:MAG: hypothetical protein OCD76_08470 [Reichenbachiella sp.]
MNKLLPYLERVFLSTLAIGYILQLTGTGIPIIITIGLAGLGITFFLNAYKPLDLKQTESEQMGLPKLLGMSIVPKILWISTAVATIGILFYTLELGNDGYLNMLYIGSLTIIIGSGIMLILKVIGTKHLSTSIPVFFRALPTLLVVTYILFG